MRRRSLVEQINDLGKEVGQRLLAWERSSKRCKSITSGEIKLLAKSARDQSFLFAKGVVGLSAFNPIDADRLHTEVASSACG